MYPFTRFFLARMRTNFHPINGVTPPYIALCERHFEITACNRHQRYAPRLPDDQSLHRCCHRRLVRALAARVVRSVS
jgi:hypothetical protein